jgi:hypothetical protein
VEPSDDPPNETSSAHGGTEEAPHPHAHEPLHVEPEIGAALMLSGNYSKALADRVFSGLTADEVHRLGQGLLRVKGLSEEQFEHIWNHITPMFTGDWREEEDLVDFIRSILRSGVRNEPALTPTQKLALLLLVLDEETSLQLHALVVAGMARGAAAELTRELAHLMHFPANTVQERVLGEFFAFCDRRALPGVGFMNLPAMELEVDRLVRRHDLSCADIVEKLWLGESTLQLRLNQSAAHDPRKLAALFKQFALGTEHFTHIPLDQRAAIFRVSLSPEATELLDAALGLDDERLPEPFVSPVRKQAVLREFLTRYYIEYASQVPLIMQ